MTAYWFYLESFVYAAIKDNDVLLYNTLTGKFLTYENKPRIKELLLELQKKENLFALRVTPEYLKEHDLEGFVSDVKAYFMGDLLDVSTAPRKPFLMSPFFSIEERTSLPDTQPRKLRNVSADSLFSLDELTIYVTGDCDCNCTICETAHKQFPWCSQQPGAMLEIEVIKEILEQTKGCPIKTINITGGDVTQYPHLEALKELLSESDAVINYYVDFRNILRSPAWLSLVPGERLILLVDCSIIRGAVEATIIDETEPDKVIFLIQSEAEIILLEDMMQQVQFEDIAVQPYFNGDNLDFFKTNVFTDKESLEENILDLETIKARSSCNTLNYGKLFITADKKIYSDVNGTPLGKIGETSITDAVIAELSEQGNWLRVRRDVRPCRDCMLHSICPPLSNFERVSGINNSCTIHPVS